MALVGRLLIGFGSAESLNRQLVSTVLAPESINAEVARLVKMCMSTIPVALLLGSLADFKVQDKVGFEYRRDSAMLPLLSDAMLTITPVSAPEENISFANNVSFATLTPVQPFLPPLPLYAPPIVPLGQRSLFTLKISLESVGYVMALLWFIHLIGMIWFYEVPKKARKVPRNNGLKSHMTQEEDFDSDTETQPAEKKSSIFESSKSNPFISEEIGHRDGTLEKLQTMKRKTVKHHSQHTYSETIADVRRLMTSNVSFPTMCAVLFIVRAVAEILFSSCGTIMSKYFNWSGGR